MTRHHLFNPEDMAPAIGFSYGAVPAEGNTVYLAGITGHHSDQSINESIVDQFHFACRSMAKVIADAGGEPTDLVSLTIYCSAMESYRSNLEAIGLSWRDVFGKHYPPMALIGVSELFDPAAKVELVGVAVVR